MKMIVNNYHTDEKDKIYDVKIDVQPLPKHCGECPFYRSTEPDDEIFYKLCFLGCTEHFGCYIERPLSCPLEYTIEQE